MIVFIYLKTKLKVLLNKKKRVDFNLGCPFPRDL